MNFLSVANLYIQFFAFRISFLNALNEFCGDSSKLEQGWPINKFEALVFTTCEDNRALTSSFILLLLLCF